MAVNFEYYKIFYYVAREKNISSAARELYITQPAVSQAIKQLEEALGTTLFIRGHRGVKLTAQGEELYSYVRSGCDMIFKGEALFSPGETPVHQVKIGTSTLLLQHFLLEYLEVFHRNHPEADIKIIDGTASETIHRLSKGEIDFGLALAPIKPSKWLATKELGSLTNIFVAGKRFQHLKYRTVSLKSLAQHPLIIGNWEESTQGYIQQYITKHNINLMPSYELSSGELIVDFAARGMGIGFVAKDYAKEAIKQGLLFELKLETPLPPRKITLLTNTKLPSTGIVDRILQGL